jgi:NTP pyrophosphatase (non-canonical NTP hydrolase)
MAVSMFPENRALEAVEASEVAEAGEVSRAWKITKEDF